MAGPSSRVQYHHHEVAFSGGRSHSALSNTASHMVVVDMEFTRRLQQKIRINEEQAIMVSNRILPPGFNALIAVPLHLLRMPLFGTHHVLTELRKLDIDLFICDFLAPKIVSYVNDLIAANDNNNGGFVLVGKLEVTINELYDGIEWLKKETFDGGDGSCPICLEELTTGIECNRMPCSHIFHPRCIIPWLIKKNTCPMCRHIFH